MEMIRRLKEEDVKDIASFLGALDTLSEKEKFYAIDDIQCYLFENEPDKYCFYSYIEGGKAVGFAAYSRVPTADRVFELDWLGVKPEYQGRGVGSALLKHIEEELKKLGARLLYLETSSMDEYSEIRRFYDRRGFFNVGCLPNFWKVGDGKVIYIKELTTREFSGIGMPMERDIIKDAYEEGGAWGLLTSIDLHECNPEKIRDEATIKQFVYELYELIEMKRYGDCEVVRFGEGDKEGYSAVQLIETSLISAHFADASSNGYIDIFSCKYYRPEDAFTFSKNFFEAKYARYSHLLRV
ncbi:hypothetical protein ES705_06143 [subsurface metagenome]